MSEMKTERKWVIGQTDRFGPSEELTTLIASAWPDNEDYYFLWSSNRAVPQSVVFDTAPQAALAAIEANDQKIYRLQLENKRLQEWYDGMIAAKAKEAKDER